MKGRASEEKETQADAVGKHTRAYAVVVTMYKSRTVRRSDASHIMLSKAPSSSSKYP